MGKDGENDSLRSAQHNVSPLPMMAEGAPERTNASADLPGILLNTLPKSASVYIWNALSVGLGIPRMRVSASWYPVDLVVLEWIKVLARGGAVSQEHIDASWQNRVLLSDHLDKMIVHVRDPRSSALEWAHHLVTEKALNHPHLRYRPYCPQHFFGMSWSAQVGYMVQHFLPDAVQWIEGWLDASDDPAFATQILFMQYERFVADEMAYYEAILEFHGIDKTEFHFTPFTPKAADDPLHEGELHYRNARLDEWRDAFTSEQIERAAELIPDRLLDRFGWPRR